MCEVTYDNFKSKYLEIEENIKLSDFIVIDCELSGLSSSENSKDSLFDSSTERYRKLRENIQGIIPLQIGVSLFHHTKDQNQYQAFTYIFYTFPRSVLSTDRRITFQPATIEFLCDYNFDFDKCYYKGLSYINREEEIKMENEIRNVTGNVELSDELEELIDELRHSVADWMSKAEDGDIFVLPNIQSRMLYDYEFIYILFRNLTQRFPTQIRLYEENGSLKVKKLVKKEHNTTDSSTSASLESQFMDWNLGFTKVFRLICDSKKPIVGHNLLIDLLIVYKEFESSLPYSYSSFKEQILNLFPMIYDTKYLSYEIKSHIGKNEIWDSNALEKLYEYFKDKQGRHIVFNSPLIEPADGFRVDADAPHNAGWDSYCIGYCFIRMAHVYACRNNDANKVFSSTEHLKAVESFANCVNVIRASVSYTKLDGEDPVSARPPWLFVKFNGHIDSINPYLLFKFFGCYVDVKPCSKNTAIVAVGNHKSAKYILSQFSNHKDLTVVQYNALKHSKMSKLFFLSGLTLSGTLLGWLTCKSLFSSTKTGNPRIS